MFLLRRAAVRSLLTSPLKARTVVAKTPSGLRQARKWQTSVFQRGFASGHDETTRTETEEANESHEHEVAGAAEQPSIVDQVKEKVQETASSVTNAAEGILGRSARGAASGTHDDPKPSKILYVGNLFFEVKGRDLEREFSSCGKVINARVAEDARGLSRGFGFVEFETIEEAEKAQRELNQKDLAGRNMAVQFHLRREARNQTEHQNKVNEPSTTLFVGNMSFQMSDKDLNDLFRNISNVLDVRVAVDRRSGQPRGFCHADFLDIPSAQKAKEVLEKKEVYGRMLRVDFSRSSKTNPNNNMRRD